MKGQKPSQIIVREFRGTQLYLVRVTRAPKGYRWSADKAKALRFDIDAALALARECSRDYGALCACQDIHGNLAQPYAINTTRDPNAEPRIPNRVPRIVERAPRDVWSDARVDLDARMKPYRVQS